MQKRASGGPLATLSALAVVLFWGLSFVSSKTILNTGFPPMTLVTLRFVIATALMLPLQRRLYPGTVITRRTRLDLALTGLLGVTIYFFFEATGLKLTSASSASLIIASIPVLTLLAELVFFRTAISVRQIAGIALSVLGVYIIVGRSPQGLGGPEGLTGNLLMLGACLSWVAYLLLSRRIPEGLPRLTVSAHQNLWGALFLIPLAFLERRSWTWGSAVIWLNILYLGLFCSALAYFLYQYALKHLGSVVLSTWINLIPVVGAVGGVTVLGEKLAAAQLVGGAVVIAGVLAVSWKRARRVEAGGPPARG